MIRNNTLILVFTLAVVLFLPACTTPYAPPCVDARPAENIQFKGLVDLVKEAPNNTLDVLLVHGMCTHDKEWADNSIGNLASAVSGIRLRDLGEGRRVEGSKALLYQQTVSIPASGILRINALVWSPIVEGLKSQLCYDQTGKRGACRNTGKDKLAYPYTRAKLNGFVKDVILNDCLADAVIYQGVSRDEISQEIQNAILDALGTSGDRSDTGRRLQLVAEEKTPLVLITNSLGSKLTFDAILKLVKNKREDIRVAGKATFNRTIQIFFGANQIPILALADDQNGDYQADPLTELIRIRMEDAKVRGVAAEGKPRVIAFTDPNDLLSYVLVPAQQQFPHEVVDVVVSNDDTLFGQFENPYTAHVGYLKNKAVTRLIATGAHALNACQAK